MTAGHKDQEALALQIYNLEQGLGVLSKHNRNYAKLLIKMFNTGAPMEQGLVDEVIYLTALIEASNGTE